MKINRFFLISLIYILCMSVLGHAREKFFIKYNYVLYYRFYGNKIPGLPFPDPFFQTVMSDYSYDVLYFIKYPMTLLFSLLFFLSGVCFFYLIKRKYLIRYFIYTYAVLFTVSGLMVVAGLLVYGKWDSILYHLSRKLMGLEQSPVPAFMIYAASLLSGRKSESDDLHSNINP